MSDIGIRELKIHASEIVRAVKEQGARYIVTHRGRPVAAIIPVEEAQSSAESESSVWDKLELLGKQIGENWQSKQSSTEILSNMRR
jgi:prevent-host-death family protein